MAKTKTPFLSLGAHGTIGGALTSQKKGTTTMIRAKPIPSYRYTLSQAYQRWDYLDQATIWNTLSVADKQAYESLARPYHMTGFAYWMRTRLNTLPDLIARWRLDNIVGVQVLDSSKNTNHGTVFGANLLAGRIDRCLHFDGIDNWVNCGNIPTAYVFPFSIEAFINTEAVADATIVCYGNTAVDEPFFNLYAFATGKCRCYLRNDAAVGTAIISTTDINDGLWHHTAVTITATQMLLYIDGSVEDSGVTPASPITLNITTLGVLHRVARADYFVGEIDQAKIYNRILTPAEIKRHSERRYPP